VDGTSLHIDLLQENRLKDKTLKSSKRKRTEVENNREEVEKTRRGEAATLNA